MHPARTRLAGALAAGVLVVAVPAGAAGAAAPRTPDDAPVDAPVTLVPLGDEPSRVSDLHSYYGELTLQAAADGLVVANQLSLERYLLGLNEVPVDWPMEALRAQAVAARTYALWTLNRPRGGAAAIYGFDLCASDQCQVYSGADVAHASGGSRWVQAVESTAGRVVTYDGEPILARYHSTSGGATLSNSEALEGSADLPYLRPVSSTQEEASPLFRWTVRFPLMRLQAILQAAGWWDESHGTLTGVRSIASRAGNHYPDVAMRGRTTLVRSAEELRAMLRTEAPSMFPQSYPSGAGTGTGRLPETLPSNRVTIRTRAHTVEIVGRGWGHGVGMSQWGAHGMAADGSDHEAILAHYYTGTSIERVPETGAVDVGLDWARSSVEVFGAFRVVAGGGETVVARALGTWGFEWDGEDDVVLRPPQGFGRRPRVEVVRAPRRVEAGRTVPLTVEVASPARLAAAPAGERPDPSAAVTRDAGTRRVPWRAPERPGRYRVRVRASTGATVRRTEPIEIVVTRAQASERELDAPAPVSGGWWPRVLLGIAALGFVVVVAVGCASFVGTIRR